MSFVVPAGAYQRFMGRFSEPLAVLFADLLDPQPGQRAVDVGCGPGALTAVLVDVLGVEQIAAIDPSPSFVTAVAARLPGVDVRTGGAERLPWPDDTFDIAAAQLVVQFMTDPVAGLREMARVTRRGGRIGACVWDHGSGRGALGLFWRAVHDLAPAATGEGEMPGNREGQLATLCGEAGLVGAESHELTVTLGFETVDEWWDPFTLGVGPPGAYVSSLDSDHRAALRDRCAILLGPAPFTVAATALTVLATVR